MSENKNPKSWLMVLLLVLANVCTVASFTLAIYVNFWR